METQNFCRIYSKLLCCLSIFFALTSCEDKYEEMLSISPEEMDVAMIGSWKLKAASDGGLYYINEEEEGLENNASTTLTKVDITKTGAVFHFSTPSPLIHISSDDNCEETGNYEITEREEMVTTIECQRNIDIFVHLGARINYEKNNRTEFIFYKGEIFNNFGFSQCMLYGKNGKASRMIIMLTGWGDSTTSPNAYFEFVRK